MMRRVLCFAALAIALTTGGAKAASVLYPGTNSSSPATGNTGVLVEQGRKGILYRMQCLDSVSFAPKNDCWPVASGNVSITVNGGASIVCALGLNPAPNTCGYAIGDFFMTGNVDTFKAVYNANFSNNAALSVAVASAVGNAGSSEAPCTTADCFLTFMIGANVPRTNASTELVFDISGSMSQPAVPAGAVQRIDALKLAANTFIEAYKMKTMLGDKLGLTTFSTTASTFPGGVPNFVAGSDPTAVNSVKSQINAQVPTNLTAIGQALQLANTNGFAADGGSTNAKWIFLFTDGEQNVAPPVSVSSMGPASALLVGGTPFSSSTNGTPDAGKSWVCPITAGNLTAPGFALQQSIADGFCKSNNAYITGGNTNLVVGDLQTYFMQRLATMLKGDKFEVSRDLQSTVSATPSVTFLGNRLDRSFLISVSSTSGVERAGYRLIAPDGTAIPLRPNIYSGGSVANVELPVIIGKTHQLKTQGTWRIVFERANARDGAGDYHVIVINDNPTIDTDFTTVGRDTGTGDPLTVRATLGDGKFELTGVKVTVDVSGPSDGLGNVLSTIPKPPKDLPRIGGDDPGPPGLQKLLLIYNDPRYAKFFTPITKPMLKLQPCDNNNDRDDRGCPVKSRRDLALATDASGTAAAALRNRVAYVANARNSEIEGHYFFTFHASGFAPDNGPFERTWKVALFVRPKPFGPKTSVLVQTLSSNDNGGLIAKLLVTPRDRIGNLIGPGYDGALAFTNSGSGNFPFITDNLDGSYTFEVNMSPASSKFVLMTLGQAVKTIDIAHAKEGQTL